jgi:hypothetical protein
MRATRIMAWVLSAIAIGNSAGCAADGYARRQAEIDAAYQRGDISLIEREHMTNALENERRQRAAAALQALQAMPQQQPSSPTIIYPRGQSYNIYDRYGNQTGTLQPR